jgi:hypothetical protein
LFTKQINHSYVYIFAYKLDLENFENKKSLQKNVADIYLREVA